jgi:hypothetical protein
MCRRSVDEKPNPVMGDRQSKTARRKYLADVTHSNEISGEG